jgi:predicted RNA binding protein YcfA (HicA-like mRNA interferase family)
MADYYRDLIELLRKHGFQSTPGRGDHEIWRNPKTGIRLTVDRKVRSRLTANGVLKEAGLPKAF